MELVMIDNCVNVAMAKDKRIGDYCILVVKYLVVREAIVTAIHNDFIELLFRVT